MHPLRFPNSGIRAKRKQRGGGAVSHDQPPCGANHPRPGRGQGPLQGGGWLRPGSAVPAGRSVTHRHDRLWPAYRGSNCLQRGAREGGRLQGARKGLPPASSPTASRGSDTSRRGGRPLVGRLPAGKGSHRLHRGSGGDGAEGERGVRASFGEKDDPAPMNSRNFEDCPR
ncbi:hypothetical protein BHE74_00040434, partial [Ensete ventricosum]